MVKFSLKSIALKWYFFSCTGSLVLFAEYFSLFMKQLGFNPAQIGVTALFGIPQLFIALCLLFGEKFRARKVLVVFGTLGASVCCMLPLLSLIVPAVQAECKNRPYVNRNRSAHSKNFTLNKSFQAKQQPIFIALDNSSAQITTNKPYAVYSNNSTPKIRITNPKIPQVASKDQGQISSKYLKDKTRVPVFKIRHSLKFNNLSMQRKRQRSVPLSYSSKPISKIHNPQSTLSTLFVLLTVSKSLTQLLQCVDLSLANLVTMAHIQGENARYGFFHMWSHIGSTLSIASVAVLAQYIEIKICGVTQYGYFIAFIWGGIMFALSMVSLPWFTFEYNDKKTFEWSRVKSDIFNAHYIFLFGIMFYIGMCLPFQVNWELWYLDELSASPLLIACAILVRRPIAATSMVMSCHCIKKIGDLNTICVALFLFASSYLALSFTGIAWLVIVIDTFQATAFGFGYCATTVLFSKTASKENASVIFGLQETVYAVGFEIGSTMMGVLFHTLGTQLTLLIFSILSAVVLVILVLYIRFSTNLHKYEKVAQDSDVD